MLTEVDRGAAIPASPIVASEDPHSMITIIGVRQCTALIAALARDSAGDADPRTTELINLITSLLESAGAGLADAPDTTRAMTAQSDTARAAPAS